jgi:hypothetical protein
MKTIIIVVEVESSFQVLIKLMSKFNFTPRATKHLSDRLILMKTNYCSRKMWNIFL